MFPNKDPSAVLDYTFDWSEWLGEGEVITAHAVTVDGATLDSSGLVGAVITAWVSGGTNGRVATVTCEITTNAGRTDQRSGKILVSDR